MKRLVEIRSYKLQPGTGETFHALMSGQSMPLLDAVQMDVVAYGHSLNDPDGYFLIRAFDDLEHLRSSEEAFYNSNAWRRGPREAILSLITVYTDAVMWMTPEGVEALRNSHALCMTSRSRTRTEQGCGD